MEYKPDIREKVLKLGIEYPLDEELIMLILGSGTSQMPIAQMARKIIQTIDSFEQIQTKPRSWLRQTKPSTVSVCQSPQKACRRCQSQPHK